MPCVLQEEGILLELSTDMGYDEIVAALAAAVQLPDSSYLRLTEIDPQTNLPMRISVARGKQNLLSTMPYDGPVERNVLFYEKLQLQILP